MGGGGGSWHVCQPVGRYPR